MKYFDSSKQRDRLYYNIMSGAARVVFYPTLMWNMFMKNVSSRRWYDRIDNSVLVGALPFKSYAEEVNVFLCFAAIETIHMNDHVWSSFFKKIKKSITEVIPCQTNQFQKISSNEHMQNIKIILLVIF